MSQILLFVNLGLNLRLKESVKQGILKGLNEVTLLSQSYDLYLFGSRVEDNKLGGDIDLLLVVSAALKEKLLLIKHEVVSKAKKYISEQRVDITIKANEELENDPFYNTVKSDLIRLR